MWIIEDGNGWKIIYASSYVFPSVRFSDSHIQVQSIYILKTTKPQILKQKAENLKFIQSNLNKRYKELKQNTYSSFFNF